MLLIITIIIVYRNSLFYHRNVTSFFFILFCFILFYHFFKIPLCMAEEPLRGNYAIKLIYAQYVCILINVFTGQSPSSNL